MRFFCDLTKNIFAAILISVSISRSITTEDNLALFVSSCVVC